MVISDFDLLVSSFFQAVCAVTSVDLRFGAKIVFESVRVLTVSSLFAPPLLSLRERDTPLFHFFPSELLLCCAFWSRGVFSVVI